MNQITFKQTYEESTVEIVVSNQSTWPEVAETFLLFMKASGYHVEAKDLAEFYDEF